MFVGINPVISHGHATMFSNPIERIRAARRRGAVITLDPRSTETARLSDHHLAVRPGTDYAVFAYVIRALLEARHRRDGAGRGGRRASTHCETPWRRSTRRRRVR